VEGGTRPRKGSVRRWKAPRVQLSSFSFAGGRARRPYPAETAAVVSGTRRRVSAGTAGQARSGEVNSPDDADVSGRRIVTGMRQEVSEPIGLGQSFHRERSRWEEPTGASGSSKRPLTRGISTGRFVQTSSGHPQLGPSPEGGDRREESFTSGRSRVRCCGVRAVVVVLADCKRLQKSTGGVWPLSPAREERADHEQGSSPAARERWRGERMPEAGSSVAKRRERWRAPHYRSR
jgi:hypothetical protein